MKKKLVSFIMLLTAMSMTLAGCGSKKQEPSTNQEGQIKPGNTSSVEQVLRMNLGADPKTLDPQLNSATDGSHIINNTFEGLMREVGGELIPGMAESYEVSEDGLVYTFKLRDAKWSDGEAIKAGDFEFAWKRGANPATASEYIDIFTSANILNAAKIAKGEVDVSELGVKALDEKTLQVTLEQPAPFFLNLTAFPTFMPVREEVVGDEAWAKTPEKALSNGPFKLSEYKMGDKLVLVKNENYWNAENVKLEKVICEMITDFSTAHTKYTAGELDINEFIPVGEIPRLMAEDDEFYVLPKIGTYYYAINMNNELMQDVNVRKALALAIDRTQIVEQVSKGGQIPSTGFMPEGIQDAQGNDFNEKAGDFGMSETADVEKAKALLAEAGYPGGEGFPEIEILYNTNDGHKAIAEAIQEMWKQNLGINVKLTNQEWAVFQDTTNNNAFSHLARRGWIGDYLDPQTMLDIFESNNGQNIGRYNNPEYDKEMQLSRTSTGQERMEHFYKAHEILMEDMPIIPIYYYVANVMVNDRVQGWELNAVGKFWFGDVEIVE
ncbi:ABC transporter substrate-binding protein [Sporanaerobium hydrogeniformans]|uniref:ABC transporter substrate-binding protein n=1 Tax=Sporanaerobium hydrogeniformans TaxID=3072179 RepID=A0AC61DH63_9FIRM|nr:peptide ABC transporter substrate-binding protein [Sporanaerobium hydrogeniformans]PHV72267.1 ABC transporter substrate-binding protein [Sporanaerobium hydrogeniformans]